MPTLSSWLWFLSLCCSLSWGSQLALLWLSLVLTFLSQGPQALLPVPPLHICLMVQTCTWPPSLFCAICYTQFPYKTPLPYFPTGVSSGYIFLSSANWYIYNFKKRGGKPPKRWCIAECYSYKRPESSRASCNCFMINTAQQSFEHTCTTSGSPVKAKLVCLSYFTF